MTTVPHITEATLGDVVTWSGVTEAIADGHQLPTASVDDTLLVRSGRSLLSRSAWIDGLGIAVKSATVFPDNAERGRPVVHGAVSLFSDDTGDLDATLDFALVTRWKTAGDSLLAATRLARPDSARVLIVGSGTVAASMVDAYRSSFPGIDVSIWSRTEANARRLADRTGSSVCADLEAGVRDADIVSCATMADDPLIRGEWLRPGQHLDLIGGFRSDMREADDACVARSRVFVDSRTTALDVGDIAGPISSGALDSDEIRADFTDLASGAFRRRDSGEITLFKNAGGAHLDLMICRHLQRLAAAGAPS